MSVGKISGKNGKVLYGTAAEIEGATCADGIITVTTVAAHGLLAKQRIEISGVVGMTDLNGIWTIVASATTDTFTITKTTVQTWSSGGSVMKRLEITSFTYEEGGEVAPAPDSSNVTYMDHVAGGLISCNGTIECLRHTGQLDPTLMELVTLELYENAALKHAGQAWLVKRSIGPVTIPGAEAVKIGYTWQGTGEWTKTDSNT